MTRALVLIPILVSYGVYAQSHLSTDFTPLVSSVPSSPGPPTRTTVSSSSLSASAASTSFSHSIIQSSSTIVSSSGTSPSGTSTAVIPIQTIDPNTLQEINTLHERRLSSVIGAIPNSRVTQIANWLSTLGPDGKWPDSDVDYTTGCEARRANWPAQEHWQRLLVMAGAWHGGLKGAEQYTKDNTIRQSITIGMAYWFSRDIANLACLDSGGTDSCPCANPDNSLWNTNWFSNIILIPELAGPTCLLLNDTLTEEHLNHCTQITGRSYALFDHNIHGVGFLTGANTLDVAKIGIDGAILTLNVTQLADAFRRVHLELSIRNDIKADGIRADGSFGQHGGILYNGNYGKDYTNDILDIEVEAGGTQFAADTTSRAAFETLFDGDRWMIYLNSLTGVLHWDFSVLGRFISFPVIDDQATGSIKVNLTEVEDLGEQWSSSTLIEFAKQLSQDVPNANAGSLTGNRMFYTNDYMVHRGRNYVSTMKMYSSRSKNTECTNSQNPLGFHLSDGVLHTYLDGDEYEDIAAAWDWNLIPGITVDYDATQLDCSHTQFSGIENFVGGVSDGRVGVAAMRYTNPLTQSLHWQKTWFFFDDDVQHVMVSNISSASDTPVFSVLDQRRHKGPIFVDGDEHSILQRAKAQSLWHGGVGYIIDNTEGAVTLTLDVGEKTGNWSLIGTSTEPPATVDLFAAWLEHESLDDTISYTTFPGTTLSDFLSKAQLHLPETIKNDGSVSAAYDQRNQVMMSVFWEASGGSVTFTPSVFYAPITLTSNGNIAVIYQVETGDISVADPSQTLSTVEITLRLGPGRKPPHWGKGRDKSIVYALPGGGLAGSSVAKIIQ
ncbi:polysaccharide lyase family 8 protein [Amanita thiersii Skay4041]|uniref:Polysaccharide lyase family 8 protein n=1 Tax=Amanita thiersii Skay4041 TaxID=703135 RepID=A0A2A9NVD6_9AGAR|nr:polysaccharide lyase family 8 protein [Amanita thiersii Skay4041]